mmetsp:Transcript_120005/g.208399  ORF Transcript_120005/g.208399 Transcript_120005/m.208399 type:complete len:401 (+) Transcript_120005:124-1326(+)
MFAEVQDSLGQIPGHAVFFGVLGGLLWGFGPLGKRYSVAGAHPKLKAARSAGTYFVCSLGAIVTPAVRLAFIEDTERLEVLANASWRSRAPFIVLAGAASGLGGLMGTCALALANTNSTALITMIENGTYAVMASMFIAGAFQEHPAPLQYLSAALVLMGIIVMQADGLGEGSSRSKGTATDSPGEVEGLLGDDCDSCAGKEASSHQAKAAIFGPSALTPGMRHECHYGSSAQLIISGGKERKAKGASSALAFAVTGGVLWAIGPLGKRWGVDSAPVELRGAYASCTSFLFAFGVLLTSACAVFRATATHPEGFFDPEWAVRVPLVLASGAMSGLGGFVGTYALALVGHEASSVVAILENGVFTVAGALLIAVVFREQPTTRQIWGAMPIVAAVFLAQLG